MKTVLLIPGFQESLKSHNYAATIKAIEGKGYKVTFVQIEWKYSTIDNWVDELEIVYRRHKPKDTILAGFSYGAMTAFVTASKQTPAELWLFSLSPYFAEDIPFLKPAWLRNIGRKRVENFKHLSFNVLAEKITCKTLLFIGEKEALKYPNIKRRVSAAEKALKNSKVIQVPNCGHDATSPKYVEAIQRTV